MPPIGQRVDPYKNFRFLVEIDGIVQAGFSECSGMGSEVQVVDYREGGDNREMRKLLGQVTYPDLELKWGVTDSRELYDWHLSAVNGEIDRRNGSVILQDDLGIEQVRWNFFNAWPSKYTGPTFDAKANDIAIDMLTVTCERLERA